MDKNLFLVGPMGAGKTTLGRLLAKTMKREFFDSDREIESRTGVTIALIFEKEGEKGFRKREHEMINELTNKHDIVLATGGGAILDKENRQFLHTRGHVVYLSASIEHLFQRTCRDKNRPLLQTENPKARLQELLTFRDPLYREVAHTILETDNSPIHNIVQQLCKTLNIDMH